MKKIVIIGKEKVGKTALFRQIIKKYSQSKGNSKPSPLVNHVEETIKIADNSYKLIDTPSLITSPKNEIEKGIKENIESLLKTSDLICWVIDEVDEESFLVKKYLKQFKVPQFLVFNKIDLINSEEKIYSCQSLGPKHFFAISTLKEKGLDKLINQITNLLPSPATPDTKKEEKELKLIIFGPPNSGKSTLMNHLLKANRSLTTPIAGTTKEPVISNWNWKKINFELIDTAGITKDERLKENVWRNCNFAWAVIDATLPLTKQVLKIINLAEKHNKPLIIVINKCDLVEEKDSLKEEVRRRLKSLGYVPIIYISALKGDGVKSLLKNLGNILEQSRRKFSKRELAETVEKMVINNSPKYFNGKKLKIYFVKQEVGLVQQFIFFVNNPQHSHFSYQRYMSNYLRKNLGLENIPIKIILKKSE
ncbi:MAG: GTPase Der [Mycoplasmataceae bacterium]|nr:MAG: GTPase Der [Mycoplasmataceae bacterium]